jgi:serine/threonine-protein kinase
MAGDIGAGHVLGRYELLMPIASGGMAMVWAARLKGSRGFQKIVAVKTMLPKLSEDEQFEQMFLDEASLASQIRHPNVCAIHDLGEQEGILYIVMEWIDGVPLNQLMKAAKKEGGIPSPIAVRIVMQACAGLNAAHELRDDKGKLVGLVHRDVSPQNILVTYDGVAKVVDFGVAKATELGEGVTQAGQIKGKVGYMAPEQVKGDAVDRRSDVFALGIVLYALTTGKHPFRRESEAATMYNICAPRPVPPPRKIKPDYPEQLEHVLLKALAKDPIDRYQTANAFLKALDQALPSDMRSTDEDVAAFVRPLLGEKREEQRKLLAQALERADQRSEIRTGPVSVPIPIPLQTPISQVSLSGDRMPLPSFADGEISGTSRFSTTSLDSVSEAAETTPRRGRIFAATVGLIVLAAGIAVFASIRSKSGSAPAPKSATTTPQAASPGEPQPPPRTTGEPAPGEVLNPDSLPADQQADKSAQAQKPAAPAKPGEAGRGAAKPAGESRAGSKKAKAEEAPAAASAAPAGSPKKWQRDPGF